MSNPYFTYTNRFVAGTRVRSEEVNRQFDAVQIGFNFLPSNSRDLTSGGAEYCGRTGGTGNAFRVRTPNHRETNETGDLVVCFANRSNTGPATLRVNDTGDVPLVRQDGQPLERIDIIAGQVFAARYVESGAQFGGGQRWQLMSVPLSIATRAEEAQRAAETARASARTAQTQAETAADNAVTDAITATQTQMQTIVSTTTQARDRAIRAATEAETHADTAESAAGSAASTAATQVQSQLQSLRDQAETFRNAADSSSQSAASSASTAQAAAASLNVGTAATYDAGQNTAGQLALIGTTGLLPTSIVPAAGSISLEDIPTIGIAKGGTGATTAAGARTALGLGSAALLESTTSSGTNVAGQVPVLSSAGQLAAGVIPRLAASRISSGVFPESRLPTISIAKGGTGATTLAGARAALGIGAIGLKSTLVESDIPDLSASKITSGTIDLARLPAIPLDGVVGTLTAAAVSDLPASKITSGTFDTARIPDLNASKITAGTLDDARVPDLNASKITAGTLNDARVPNLNASKITAGTFAEARIPALNANKVSTGVFSANQVPNLDASKITSGQFAPARIPGIPAGRLQSGTIAPDRLASGGSADKVLAWSSSSTLKWIDAPTASPIASIQRATVDLRPASTTSTFVDVTISSVDTSKVALNFIGYLNPVSFRSITLHNATTIRLTHEVNSSSNPERVALGQIEIVEYV